MRLLLTILIFWSAALFAGCREELLEEVRHLISANAEVAESRDALLLLIDELSERGVVERFGSDAEYRPLFVTLQGSIEQVLANYLVSKRVAEICGAIHTPTPATPCCTEGEITPGLADASLLEDPKRLYTIRSRATTVRNYLEGGGRLWVVYPAAGLSKRSSEQLEVYSTLREHYSTLIDNPLEREELEASLVGATYLFSDEEGDSLFSIQAFQANAPVDEGLWRLWLGPLSDEQISARLEEVGQIAPIRSR